MFRSDFMNLFTLFLMNIDIRMSTRRDWGYMKKMVDKIFKGTHIGNIYDWHGTSKYLIDPAEFTDKVMDS